MHCRMHLRLCFCAEVRPAFPRTKLLLVTHRRETHKSTNSAQILRLALPATRRFVRGRKARDGQLADDLLSDHRPLLLYPYDDALPLTSELASEDSRPTQLIIPDGTWIQARKTALREPSLRGVARVRLPAGIATTFWIRRHFRDDSKLSTAEAAAYALGVLESSSLADHVLHLFRIMVDRVLWTRGVLPAERVYGGIPAIEAPAGGDGAEDCATHPAKHR